MGSKNLDYIFASARVRSVENNLLTKEKADKMIDSKTHEDALKVLYEMGYGEEAGTMGTKDFDTLLLDETKKTYEFIRSIAPDKSAFDAFLYPYDYHNLKVLLKAEFSKTRTEAESFLMDLGTMPVAVLAGMVRERSFAGLPEEMKAAVQEVIDVFSRTQDPQTVDFVLDRACYAQMKTTAFALGNTFICEYVTLLIDTINLKTFVRQREMGKNWDFFSKVFLPGGSISESLFVNGYDETYEQFSEKLLTYGFTEVLLLGAAGLRESGRFTELEKCCDDKIMDFAKKAKYISFGIEPLAAYLIAKEGEIRCVRIIIAGLLQGLSREMIKERQRETYV